MRISFIIFLFSVLFYTACEKNSSSVKEPVCLTNHINAFSKTCCSDAKVHEYTFQNRTVYVFASGTCGADLTSEVMDSDCNTLGYLGGLTGNTKINGEDFSHAAYQNTVWEK